MNKPTIFFSHSSTDKAVLMQLKVMFQEKTGGSIDLFLSSDGQSIPLGRNWVHKVQEGLEAAAIMVVFLTPASVSSQWVYFEAGFAYCKGIRVIPVGFLGVDLTKVNPPLGLLQGFNIKSKDGLDNLIAMTNEEFKHDHKNHFNDDEYTRLINLSQYPASESTTDEFRIVRQVLLGITDKKDELLPEQAFLNKYQKNQLTFFP